MILKTAAANLRQHTDVSQHMKTLTGPQCVEAGDDVASTNMESRFGGLP